MSSNSESESDSEYSYSEMPIHSKFTWNAAGYLHTQPSIDSRAFDKSTSAYVKFQTQSDALLASLQIFHDVPCRIMDLIFSVVTHPAFDAKDVTLGSSVDIARTVEEARLENRAAVTHERALNSKRVVEQAGFPQFVLQEVLDIIEAEKVACIEARFEESLDEGDMHRSSRQLYFKEDEILSNMSLVHRSWTTPAQKVLGRSLYIGKPLRHMRFLLQYPEKAIFGPWTTLVAIDLFHPITYLSDDYNRPYGYHKDYRVDDEVRQWFECLHRFVIGFENLRVLFVRSHAEFFTEWSSDSIRVLIRQNRNLEELTLYAMEGSFYVGDLREEGNVLENLRALSVRGRTVCEADRKLPFQVRGLTFKGLKDGQVEDELAILTQLSPHCPRIKHLNIKTNLVFSAWPTLRDSIPPDIRSLNIHFTDIENFRAPGWKAWAENVLELPRSARFPALKSLTLNLARWKKTEIRALHKSMKVVCKEAGITYK